METVLAQVRVHYSTSGGLSAIWFVVFFLIGIAYYVAAAYFLMKLADRLGVENSWFAFVPFLNLWLICEMGQREINWFVIMLVFSFCCSLVTLVMMILIMMDVAEMLGFDRVWGILMIIPFFNIYVLYKLAYQQPY